jgi:hypothetical protein
MYPVRHQECGQRRSTNNDSQHRFNAPGCTQSKRRTRVGRGLL